MKTAVITVVWMVVLILGPAGAFSIVTGRPESFPMYVGIGVGSFLTTFIVMSATCSWTNR